MAMSQSGSVDQHLPPVELSSYDQLILVAVAVLEQAVDLVENSLTEDSQLSWSSVLIPGSTIGKWSHVAAYHVFCHVVTSIH